jgi:tetratricopeptide (TPR) repeat protein
MKALISSVIVIGIVAGLALLWRRPHTSAPVSGNSSLSADGLQPAGARPQRPASVLRGPAQDKATGSPVSGQRLSASNKAASSAAAAPSTVDTRFESLLDPHTEFARKQEIWAELTKVGKLDLAIAELETRAKENPSSAEIPAALGRAYLQKAGSLDDVREQGILGMKADQTFEDALGKDPQNWDARFWKAMAMSHWPVQLNKTAEVVDDLLKLVNQQEAGLIRPEFVQTYLLLGEQYEKSGQAEYAKQIWQRGLALFPDHSPLKDKLAKTL